MYGLFVIYLKISSRFEMHSLETKWHHLFRLTGIHSQEKVFVGVQTDVSLVGTNLVLRRVLSTNLELNQILILLIRYLYHQLKIRLF